MKRLDFLKRLVLGAAAVAVSPKLLAEEPKRIPKLVIPPLTKEQEDMIRLYEEGHRQQQKIHARHDVTIHSRNLPGACAQQVWLFNNDLCKPLITDNGSGHGSISYNGIPDAKIENVHYFSGFELDGGGPFHVTISSADAVGNIAYLAVYPTLTPEQFDSVKRVKYNFRLDRFSQIGITIKPGETIRFVPIEDDRKIQFQNTTGSDINELLFNLKQT